MKKPIILEDNSEIKEDCIVQFYSEFHKKEILGIVLQHFKDGYELEYSKNEVVIWHPIENKNIKKVQLYIVDTKMEEIEIGSYIYNEFCDEIYKFEENTDYGKDNIAIIATSNSELPLPQLSPQSIELIIEKNGKIGEFDVEIKCTQCEEWGYINSCRKGCNGKFKIANIISKSSKKR